MNESHVLAGNIEIEENILTDVKPQIILVDEELAGEVIGWNESIIKKSQAVDASKHNVFARLGSKTPSTNNQDPRRPQPFCTNQKSQEGGRKEGKIIKTTLLYSKIILRPYLLCTSTPHRRIWRSYCVTSEALSEEDDSAIDLYLSQEGCFSRGLFPSLTWPFFFVFEPLFLKSMNLWVHKFRVFPLFILVFFFSLLFLFETHF